MKMPRSAFAWLSFVSSVTIAGPLASAALVAAPLATLAGCADESDPKTWVKRLDDQAQRATAIKRLDEMFNEAMRNSSNNRDDAKVKSVVDDSVEGLAKTYTAGGLDDKTR
jgi:hypothetical protein